MPDELTDSPYGSDTNIKDTFTSFGKSTKDSGKATGRIYSSDTAQGVRTDEIRYAKLEGKLRDLAQTAASAEGDYYARDDALQDARDNALKEINIYCDNSVIATDYLEFFDNAYADTCSSKTNADGSEQDRAALKDTLQSLARSAALTEGDDDDREGSLQDARDAALDAILIHTGCTGDDEEQYMDFFDNAYAEESNSYDAVNLRKPIVSGDGKLNPGIYSVDDDVFRIGSTSAMSQFRHGAWRPVRAAGAKQDSEYKLKRRGEHAKASLLKTLGKTSESCLLCGKPLEDDEAIARGVGGSCARKYGIR